MVFVLTEVCDGTVCFLPKNNSCVETICFGVLGKTESGTSLSETTIHVLLLSHTGSDI
ncbi:hypothetical protein KA405_04350 [Patescibacteria group bacterium]|nr:hypothetical protein [Patescibacteria group bacterium]